MTGILKVDTILKRDGSVPSASDLGIKYAPGEVIQNIIVKPTVTTSFGSASYTDATGFTASITPKYSNSAIVISIWSKTEQVQTSLQTAQDHRLLRNGSQIYSASWQNYFNRTSLATDIYPIFTCNYVDFPGLTTLLTYNLQGRIYAGSYGSWEICKANGGSSSAFMSIMEVAQ